MAGFWCIACAILQIDYARVAIINSQCSGEAEMVSFLSFTSLVERSYLLQTG